MTKTEMEFALHWQNISDTLKGSTEQELLQLIQYEKSTSNRPTTLKRLHHRHNLLRGRREKGELTKR